MKVHLRQVPTDGIHIEGEDDNGILELNDPGISPSSPVRYWLDVGLSDGGLFATGRLEVDMQMRCVGCLETFTHLIHISDFACQIELTGSETVDLTPDAREDILLALPAHPRCNQGGPAGKCQPAWPASTAGETASPEPQRVWGALDQLNLKQNK